MDFLTCRWPGRGHWFGSVLVCVSVCVIFTPRAWASDSGDGGVVTVHAETLTRILRAYGQVEPIAIIPVRTVYPGTLQDLNVVPGNAVTTGEVLAHITGPRIQSLLTSREQTLHSQQARAKAADRTLAVLRSEFKLKLTTQQAVSTAESELAAARAAVKTAGARLQEARKLQVVRAPAAGTVMAVDAGNGEQTTADQTLMTLLPTGKLWMRAAWYGSDVALLHVGMKGQFQPADGSEPIPVKVTAIAPSVSTDGGRLIGFLPLSSSLLASWANGQWGTVRVDGPAQRAIPVPTSALILDRGNWWVLLRTPQGDKPQKVVPGTTRGWQTWITSGLRSGQQIVVEDAYLKYHRGIAQSYQPPD